MNYMDRQKRFIENISEDAQEAIETYTGAVGYRINRYLREHRPLDDQDQRVVEELDKLFENIPPLKTPVTVWRDMDLELHDHLQEGYISTSLDSDQLDSDDEHTEPQCCQYQIEVPAGTKVLPVKKWSVNRNENEVLLPRNSYFRYIGREVKRGAIWIYLRLVDADQVEEMLHAIQQQSEQERERERERESKVAETAAHLIQLLQSGQLQEELAEENELFDDDEGTTLQEYVHQRALGMIPATEIPAVLQLIDMANYS